MPRSRRSRLRRPRRQPRKDSSSWRWNEALQAVQRIEGEMAAIVARKPAPLGEREQQQLMQLGADLELAWSHPAATAATPKRSLPTALNEIAERKKGASIKRVLNGKAGII